MVGVKCQSRRGIGKSEGTTRNKRTCIWLDRSNGVHTYRQAQAFNDTIINIRNTVWFKAFPDYQKEEALAAAAQAMAKEESGDQAEEEANASPSANLLRDTIFDLPHDISGRPGREFILMVEIAQRTIDMVGGNTIPNRDTIVAEAQRQRQAAAFNPTDFETRVQAVKVYVTVVTHLYNTVGLTAADVQSFLPVGHPGNDDMRLRKKASHKACQVRWRVNRDAVLWSMKGGQIIC